MTEITDHVLEKNTVYQKDVQQMKIMCAQAILKTMMDRHITDYVLNADRGGVTATDSQRGMILMLCKSLRYKDAVTIKSEFDSYFGHAESKDYSTRVYRENYKPRNKLFGVVKDILNHEKFGEMVGLEEFVCGFPVSELIREDDIMRYKLSLITALIKFYNKETGGANE